MSRFDVSRFARSAVSLCVPLCLGLALAGCGGGGAPDGDGDAPESRDGAPAADTEGATAPGAGGDTAPVREVPAATDTTEPPHAAPVPAEGGAASDTPADASPADTAPPERYFVRLRGGTDPDRFAARHGLEPMDVIRDPVPALYTVLTPAEWEELYADSAVVSLAREIHQADSLRRPPIRGMPVEEDSAP